MNLTSEDRDSCRQLIWVAHQLSAGCSVEGLLPIVRKLPVPWSRLAEGAISESGGQGFLEAVERECRAHENAESLVAAINAAIRADADDDMDLVESLGRSETRRSSSNDDHQADTSEGDTVSSPQVRFSPGMIFWHQCSSPAVMAVSRSTSEAFFLTKSPCSGYLPYRTT